MAGPKSDAKRSGCRRRGDEGSRGTSHNTHLDLMLRAKKLVFVDYNKRLIRTISELITSLRSLRGRMLRAQMAVTRDPAAHTEHGEGETSSAAYRDSSVPSLLLIQQQTLVAACAHTDLLITVLA